VELERRTTAPAHATGAVEFVPLEAISEDATFRLRDEGDVAPLASSIGRLGQLVPVELRPLPGAAEGGEGPRFQVVAGFRRLAALRMLARERVLARVHETLEDDDARALALALALVTEPLLASELQALRERLAASGEAPWVDEALEEALARAPVDPRLRERFVAWLERADEAEAGPEPEEAVEEEAAAPEVSAAPPGEAEGPVEVTPDELADDLAARMFEVNQDLSLAYESWAELPPEGRRMIVEQARYVAELLRLLERDGE
jgi:ParB-like chromosome segregation protein Spo0J